MNVAKQIVSPKGERKLKTTKGATVRLILTNVAKQIVKSGRKKKLLTRTERALGQFRGK